MAGLYVHIPFCVKKCVYCDFVSFPCPEKLPEYLAALRTEVFLAAEALPENLSIDTIFFGGGTPSLMEGAQLTELMRDIRSAFSVASDAEISMECNPGAVTEGKLYDFRSAGINRLSIGAQSMEATLLEKIGRIHTPEQTVSTVQKAQAAGFVNINIDVMHGLPGQTEETYLDTLRTVARLDVTHVSSYALILEEGTPLFARVASGQECLPEPDAVADMEDAGIGFLEKAGYARYEISNFAKPGFCCKHNLNYWENGSYIGLGVQAHSCMRLPSTRLFDRGETVWTRWANTEDLNEYLSKLRGGKRPQAEKILLYPADEMFETVMLGLRLVAGLDKDAFFRRFGVTLEQAYPKALAELAERGWLSQTETHLALNRMGLDMQNAALQLFM